MDKFSINYHRVINVFWVSGVSVSGTDSDHTLSPLKYLCHFNSALFLDAYFLNKSEKADFDVRLSVGRTREAVVFLRSNSS